MDDEVASTTNVSVSSSSSKATGKSKQLLSRASLYSPLSAFHPVNPFDATTAKSIPKSIHETSLVSFLATISKDYHQNTIDTTGTGTKSTKNEARNSGARPLSAKEMDDKIRQRALTLAGPRSDGTRSKTRKRSVTTDTDTGHRILLSSMLAEESLTTTLVRRRQKERRREKKRKRKKQNLERKSEMEDEKKCGNRIVDACFQIQINFLIKLNTAWNEYIWNLLGKVSERQLQNIEKENTTKQAEEACQFVTRRIQQLLVPSSSSGKAGGESDNSDGNCIIEWVGAKARIDECRQHPSWVGRVGIVVQDLANIWRLVFVGEAMKQQQQQQPGDEPEEEKDNNGTGSLTTATSPFTKIMMASKKRDTNFLVPKRGSSLTILLPVHHRIRPDVDPLSNNVRGQLYGSSMAADRPRHNICIVLSGDQ